ncbi:hypothetical protein [Lutibacter sp.]|uniref:hypothetical protein n=1 Tax=Lutibacter sp. TaxID=1925666 RepID=UPI0025B97707|nr:hypothetical protein [Lutibacter sp.]MCF6182700.1 hypothetical protein [Lutibacter sp.]
MNKRILNIITSSVMFLAFFMTWVKAFGFGGSAFDALIKIFKNIKFIEKEPSLILGILVLIFPISAIIIFVKYSKNKITKNQVKSLEFVKKLPLVFIIFIAIYLSIKIDRNYLRFFKSSDIVDIIGIGLILTLISSIVLFIDKTEVLTTHNNSKNKITVENNENINKL